MATRKKSEVQAFGALAGALLGVAVVAITGTMPLVILLFVLAGSGAGSYAWGQAQK